MDLWYTEKIDDGVGLTLKVKEHLYHKRTAFQTIDVLKTAVYGRVMTIDGMVMLTEGDEFVYHELLTHVPLQFLKSPERVLIIGGGDGGTAREVLKYPEIKEVVMVEIDKDVVDAAKKFFPGTACSFQDPRLRILIDDGAAFVKEEEEEIFDLVIIDSTDPIGPAEVLFSEDFYAGCSRILNSQGILTTHTESPFHHRYRDTIALIHRRLRTVLPKTFAYLGSIPTYPFGLFSFAFASRGIDPRTDPFHAGHLPTDLKYYNHELARGAFALPNFMQRLMP